MLWGQSLSFWESVFLVVTYVAAIAGGLSVLCALSSAIIGYRITDVIQRESDEKIVAANERIAKSEQRARESEERIAIAERQTAEANQKAAEANLRAAEIEASLAWRRIPKAKQLEMASRLERFSGQTASLWFSPGDRESEGFAQDIASTLSEAKWKVSGPALSITLAEDGHMFGGPTAALETGVIISSPVEGTGRDAGNAVSDELIVLGFDVVKLADSRRYKSHGSTIVIEVSTRPEGPQGEAKLRAQKKNTK
jgi:hypothetical protein